MWVLAAELTGKKKKKHWNDQCVLYGQLRIILAVWAWEPKVPPCPWFHGTVGTMLRSKHGIWPQLCPLPQWFRGYKQLYILMHIIFKHSPHGAETDQSSLCTQRVAAKDPSFLHATVKTLVLIFAGRMPFQWFCCSLAHMYVINCLWQ